MWENLGAVLPYECVEVVCEGERIGIVDCQGVGGDAWGAGTSRKRIGERDDMYIVDSLKKNGLKKTIGLQRKLVIAIVVV